MRKTHTTDVIFDHEKMTFTDSGFRAEIRFDKIRRLDINEAAHLTAECEKIPVGKILASQPELADQLQFNFIVSGNPFCFMVDKQQGVPLADRLMSRIPPIPNRDPAAKRYPVHINSMTEGLFA